MNTKILAFLLLILLLGCKRYDEMITTWYHTSDELEEWLIASNLKSFRMIDQNGISREFVRYENSHNFTQGSSYFAGIKHRMHQKEDYYQAYRSSFLDHFTFMITAAFGEDNEGDSYWGEQIHIRFNQIHFNYDFKFNEILNLSVNQEHRHVFVSTAGIEDTLLNSSISLFDTLILDSSHYGKTLHFLLDDLHEYWDQETVTELYFTQDYGLIYYKTNNGIEYYRQP